MEMSRLILVSLTLVWCLGGFVEGFTYDDKEVETEEGKAGMFERWRSHHKMEKISDLEKQKQFKAFKHNLEIVHSTNKANKPYKLEMNRYAGMTKEEFKSKLTGLKASPLPKIKAGMKWPVSEADWSFHWKYRNVTDIPPAVDWRTQGVVTRAKLQGPCGSCYAFAGADAIEGLHAIRTKQLIELSPKEILDCCDKCHGCDGGSMTDTFTYVKENKGLTTEKNYPYTPKFEECSTKKENDIAVEIHGYELVPLNNEKALEATVAHQPVVISMAADEPFLLYKEGILTAPCTLEINLHAILAVGYDTAPDGTKYWIMKNSWGEAYGEKGFIRMLRGVPEKEGYCGVNQFPTFPTFEDCPNQAPNKDPVVHMSTEL